MYSFVSDILGEEHDLFVKNHPLCNLLQSSKWADVKNNWAHAIVGLRENGMLAASALVLIKKMPAGLCAMYIPADRSLTIPTRNL